MSDSATPPEPSPSSQLKSATIETGISGILATAAAIIPNTGVRLAITGLSPFVGVFAGIWIRHLVARYNYNHRGRWLREEVTRLSLELARPDLTDTHRAELLEQLRRQNAKLADLEPPALGIS